ncbi:MAG TPA: ATP synthase F0 subunit C [Isosphaeraceae bacterium]|jgi:F-type H+-transporting ATPase subunit c|nr:ATP synthase F0 subunit C [Isosphaeraceae bacterium]
MKPLKSVALAVALFALAQAPASAQETGGAPPTGAAATAPATSSSYLFDLRSVAVGLVIIGAGYGIGILARAAVESQARQPEMAGRIQTTMIIAAALIEGVTLFGLVIILLAVNQGK